MECQQDEAFGLYFSEIIAILYRALHTLFTYILMDFFNLIQLGKMEETSRYRRYEMKTI